MFFLSRLQQIQCDGEMRWIVLSLLQLSMAGEMNGAHNSTTVIAAFWSSLLIVMLTTPGCGTLSTRPLMCRQSGSFLVLVLVLLEQNSEKNDSSFMSPAIDKRLGNMSNTILHLLLIVLMQQGRHRASTQGM